ncbi:MAG: hypothetical protein AMJ79_06945 [Phycisphaerae bacterium SM23_30]|nr:MAG: hypothetical protein AMJ79_06945 [Phycisphaerae bacterium SM23_30]
MPSIARSLNQGGFENITGLCRESTKDAPGQKKGPYPLILPDQSKMGCFMSLISMRKSRIYHSGRQEKHK